MQIETFRKADHAFHQKRFLYQITASEVGRPQGAGKAISGGFSPKPDDLKGCRYQITEVVYPNYWLMGEFSPNRPKLT